MPNKKILDALFAAVDVTNEQLPPQSQLDKTAETRISGDGAALDSMGLVSLILAAESKTAHLFNQPINLTENLLTSETGGIPETLGDLALFIASLECSG